MNNRKHLTAREADKLLVATKGTRNEAGAVMLEQLQQATREGPNSGRPAPWHSEEIKREGRKRRAARVTSSPEA